MILQGKGFFTWKIPKCENGNPNAIADLAQSAGLTHVLVKIADGSSAYFGEISSTVDLVPALVQALRARSIQVWGWQYVYGDNPIGEARIAIQRSQAFHLDGLVIDAEGHYKQPGKKDAAVRYMKELRTGLPTLPLALSSYRYPSLHPQLPWKEFLEKCDFNMPQVYWMQAHNPAEQLTRTVREFQALTPLRPIIPTGAAFREYGWQSTASEAVDFLRMARALNLSGANFWEWSDARSGNLPGVWEAIRDFSWSGPLVSQDICQKFVDALNARDENKMSELYMPTAVHVTAARTIQGLEAIRNWYRNYFTQILPNAKFRLTGFSGTGSSRHFTWTATSSLGSVNNGNDTLGLINDKIAYQYTFFTIS